MLADEKIVGWFNGRMEFGPRALGARSILGDPRSPRMQAEMNIKIKFREGFRPFAPSVLRERVADYFELDCDSPYMLLVAPVKKERQIPMTDGAAASSGASTSSTCARSDIPAVTHIDYSARVQTVSRDANPDYYDLIRAFERADRLPGPREHVVQRARRADRLHAGGRVPLLHAHAHRYSGARPVPARQGGTARMEGDGGWQQEFQLD